MNNEGAIIIDIQKRPFFRPLLFWIAGIVLEVCFPLQNISFVLPAIVAIIIVLSFVMRRQDADYQYRWVWGVIFMSLVVFLAIQITALAETRFGVPSKPSFLVLKAQELQSYMVDKLGTLRLPDADKSVLATITVNYRRAMSWELRSQFSMAGVSHLLAVSGFHVGIVCVFVNALLFFLSKRNVVSRWVKFVLTMLFMWAFVYVSGLSAASVRAAVMISIYLTGKVLRRNPDKYNTLAATAFLMLVYNPFYLFDIGFQLSFSAVFFILYLQPRLSKFADVRNPLIAVPWNVLTISVAAQVGTVFLCFFYFGKSSAVFLFTNLFLSLLATILVPATLLYMLLPSWLPGINLLQSVIEVMTRWMMWIVGQFASLPGATYSLRFDFVTLICSYLCLFLFILYVRTRRFWMIFAAFVTLLAILCWQFLERL